MHPRYPHIFSPIKIGPVEIPNRFYFAPHGVGLTIGTHPSSDFAYYSVERVRNGGCGLVVTSLTVNERASMGQSSPYLAANVPAFRALADTIHDAGGKIFAEIWYWWGVPGFWQPLSTISPPLGASAVQFHYGMWRFSTHEMGKDEIKGMADSHRQSAAHLAEAGYDGVMIHAGHGGLLEHFLSPHFNRRTDEYGGSAENRMRFLVETLEATRGGAGDGLAVGMRFNCDELIPSGYDSSDARDMLEKICGAGLVDFVDLDIAIEPNQLHLGMPPIFVEPHVYRPYVEKVRSATGDVPVLSVLGRLTSLVDGEAAIAAGVCDMVGAARALIAEPELVQNANRGTEARSRTCIACNACLEAVIHGSGGCTINPASYRERLWGVDTFTPAPKPSKVIIVGGGPAGLEAARVSARRGHDVTLYEARDRLGGALALWAGLPAREVFFKAIEWWEREVERLGVTVRRGTEATGATLLAERPDAVIVATGAPYSRTGRSGFCDLDIPGWDRDFVHRPEDVLHGGARPSGNVLVLDGEGLHAGVGIAEVLASAGAEVEYMSSEFAPVSASLFDTQEADFVIKRLRALDVRFSLSTYIRSIGDHEVTVYDVFTDQERTIERVDAVVLSTGRLPLDSLARELEGKVAQLYTVGDALAVRPWRAAAFEGQKFARYVGEPDAPTTICQTFFGENPPEMTPVFAETLLGVGLRS